MVLLVPGHPGADHRHARWPEGLALHKPKPVAWLHLQGFAELGGSVGANADMAEIKQLLVMIVDTFKGLSLGGGKDTSSAEVSAHCNFYCQLSA